MMPVPVLESQVKSNYFEPFYNHLVIAGKANMNTQPELRMRWGSLSEIKRRLIRIMSDAQFDLT
jgi:hypothetical protein